MCGTSEYLSQRQISNRALPTPVSNISARTALAKMMKRKRRDQKTIPNCDYLSTLVILVHCANAVFVQELIARTGGTNISARTPFLDLVKCLRRMQKYDFKHM